MFHFQYCLKTFLLLAAIAVPSARATHCSAPFRSVALRAFVGELPSRLEKIATVTEYRARSKEGGVVRLIQLDPWARGTDLRLLEAEFTALEIAWIKRERAKLIDFAKATCAAGVCYAGITYAAGGIYIPLENYLFSEAPLAAKAPVAIGALATGVITGGGLINTLIAYPIMTLKSFYKYVRGNNTHLDSTRMNSKLRKLAKRLKEKTKKGEETIAFVVGSFSAEYSMTAEWYTLPTDGTKTLEKLGFERVERRGRH